MKAVNRIVSNNIVGKYCRDLSVLQVRRKATAVQSFDNVPGPRQIKLLGALNYPLTLKDPLKLHLRIDELHKQYGPIFTILLGSTNAIFLSSAESVRQVFLHEGRYPIHPLPPAWTYFNETYNYKRGLFFMDGQEWMKFRTLMNPFMLRDFNDTTKKAIEAACDRLIQKLTNLSPSQEENNLEILLYQWSIDVILSVVLGHEVDPLEIIPLATIQEFTNVVHKLFISTCAVSSIPPNIAHFLRLSRWKEYVSVNKKVLELGNKIAKEVYDKCPSTSSGLMNAMKGAGMGEEDIQRIFTDLIIAAGDTTAFTTQWCLYLLGKNPIVQKEVKASLQNIDPSNMNSGLIKGTVKETLRLYPTAFVIGRLLTTDCVIEKYNIPINTMALISLYTAGRMEEHFPSAEKFLPMRWIREGSEAGAWILKPQASMPFAIGTRSCIGQKIANHQMHALLTKLLQRYSIQVLNEGEVEAESRMVLVPKENIRIRLS